MEMTVISEAEVKKIDKTVAVGMPQELYDELKKLAAEDSRSVPGYIRSLLWERIGKK